ncbi:MAG TPA: acyl-CoA dehydrogenase family protein [Syntrophales bacterium]|nr:acyl-CoA dehydrogenase family protein [Syntrophales bacterium]
MAMTGHTRDYQKEFSRFAEKEIASRRDLHTEDDFPLGIWRKMASAGMLGVSIPRAYGGLGGGYAAVVAAGEGFVESGHNMGLALSWVIHQVASRFFIHGFGTESQRERYLPALAEGTATASIAISEPGVGANPKNLKTSAVPEGGGYLVQGEKSYLTNGPIADLFIVFAVTSESDGRKEYTAFLVPKDTPGLSLTEPLKLDYLRPSPHCGITVDSCRVRATDVLGEVGSAYRKMVIPFRDLEDALLMGPVIGGMKAQIDFLVTAYMEATVPATDGIKTELGALDFLARTMRVCSYQVARMIDSGMDTEAYQPLLLSLRYLAKDFQSRVERLAGVTGLSNQGEFKALTTDIGKIINIAGNVALIKQKKLGERLLSQKGEA